MGIFVYSVSKHLRDSFISLFGKNGNFLWITVIGGGASWLWMKVYNSLCIEFGGSISFWLDSINLVYGCCVWICLSGGLVRLVNLLISVLVHSILKL